MSSNNARHVVLVRERHIMSSAYALDAWWDDVWFLRVGDDYLTASGDNTEDWRQAAFFTKLKDAEALAEQLNCVVDDTRY